MSDKEMARFNKATITATCTLLMSFAVFAVLTIVSFRPPTGEMKVTPPKTKFKSVDGDKSPGLLIGQDYTK